MKITTFNPLIITRDAEPVIALLEELGFRRHHAKKGIGINDVTDIRMKDDNGFHLYITQGDGEYTMIRMNVDNLDEAVALFEKHGFRRARHAAVNDTVDTGSSKFQMMVSPSGYIVTVSEHFKNHE